MHVVRRCFRFVASSALATVTIGVLAAVLAWATWVEKTHGTEAVQFGVYQSTWFAALLLILGVNVLAAALIRFPWQRKQIGFLIVHAGILVLLVGCWITQDKSVVARLTLYEGDRRSQAVGSDRELLLTVQSFAEKDRAAGAAKATAPRTMEIPFRPGPFNWSDYDRLGWFPWRVARRDRGILHDRDGIRIEVLDYCGDSRRVDVPELKLRLGNDAATLAVREFREPAMGGRPLVVGSREPRSAAAVVFRMALCPAETKAFLDGLPRGSLGRLGQLVLSHDGKTYRLPVEDLQGKGLVPLGQSGVRVELARFDPESLRVLLKVFAPEEDKPTGLLMLGAADNELDQQDQANGVFGSYWYAPSEQPVDGDKKADASAPTMIPELTARAAAAPRLDVLQGDDLRLYYRTWSGGRIEASGRLPTDGSTAAVFGKGDAKPTASVVSFLPSQRPERRVVPVPFDRERPFGEERVRVRLTVDGQTRETWLADPFTGEPGERFTGAHGKDRVAMLRLSRPMVDLGFMVELRDFECRFDPGTSRASHYESRVDFLSADGEPRVLEKNVSIWLNHPARFTDPASGRTFRFFQTGYDGPFVPEQLADHAEGEPETPRDRVYRSDLTVAHDPGRQWKYAGCLMILAGIMVMYYMKAYFFRRRT